MKTAREVACESCRCGNFLKTGVHFTECDERTDAIDQARRDGAEQMREHIARETEKRQLGSFAVDIRAMPVTS